MNAVPPTRRRFPLSAPLSLGLPVSARFDALVREQMTAPLTYEPVGGTRLALPLGWSHDDGTVPLGSGRACFDEAVAGLQRWSQFDLGWVRPHRTDVPIEEGEHFAFGARFLGVWFLNVCRIVYVVDEDDDPVARFGFAYGTLGTHTVQGEESFVVSWSKETDEVTFTIRKFSRPAGWMFRVAGPVTRWLQRRFTVDALRRLAREVGA